MYLHSALKLLALSDPVGVRGRGRNQVVNKGKHTHCATVLWQKHRQEGEVYALTLAHAHTHTHTHTHGHTKDDKLLPRCFMEERFDNCKCDGEDAWWIQNEELSTR